MGTAAIALSGEETARLASSLAACAMLAVAVLASASAQDAAQAVPGDSEALAPLIGEWEVGPAGAKPSFVETFTWGPNRAYVWTSVVLLDGTGDEHLHFEGIIIWNAASRRFDYLFAVEPGSMTQERGEYRIEADGRIVRDVVLTDGKGETAQFQQTFLRLDERRFRATLMRRTADGWTPTFPGSDDLTMVRRSN